VVSGTAHNDVLSTVVIIPTSSIAPEIRPLRVAVGTFAGKHSYAVVPGVRQVRKGRIRGTLGELSADRLEALDDCLQAYLE
jgi:mRNA-degrading endonuclease toxin of MazEF toxin-antitoxin module